MATFQELIKKASLGKSQEEYRAIDIVIRIKTYGKVDQLWKMAQSIWRHLRVSCGDTFSFYMPDGEKITDDYSDDEGEMWHSHDWKADPDVRPEPAISVGERHQESRTGSEGT